MKRNAGVPRGLLRFLVLKYLVEKPMTGVEIVETIEAENGWKVETKFRINLSSSWLASRQGFR